MGSNGPSWGRRQHLRRETREALAKAQREVDLLTCRNWNLRMADGGPAMPSPSISQALNAKYHFLRVKCAGCRTLKWITLADVKRPPETPIWQLEGALACAPCRARSARAPRATIERLCFHAQECGWGNL